MRVEQNIWEDFSQKLRGPLLLPGDAGYEAARAVWNGMIDRRPGAIARCLGVADVVAGVNFARTHGLKLSIRGGGHNISGMAVCEGGLMLDMSLMRGVWVDPQARTARAQAGCLLGDVDRETQLHGLAAVLGFISNTGIAGLTLGGGFGYLTRKYGWTCDNVISMEAVTADGRVVRASADENPDLFWGLRGGGGNFGVVTGFEYKLYPVGPEVVAGAVAWRAEDAPAVLERYRSLIEEAPRELTTAVVLRPAPPAPWLPADVHGKPVILFMACDTGPIEEAEARLAGIKALGPPIGDVLMRRTYISQQTILDASQPHGRRYYWKSEYLPGIAPELVTSYLEHGERFASSHGALILFHLGGALGEGAPDHSAAGNRDTEVVLNITASWDDPADDEANVAWARGAWEAMRRYSTGGTYVNFLTEEEGEERIRTAYGANYDRLVEVKTKWDPGNLFQVNKNIAPQPRSTSVAATP